MKHNFNNVNKNLPNVSRAVQRWFLNIEIAVVKRILEGVDWREEVDEITGEPIINTIKTQGVVQPADNETLKILPEGTWSWEWLMIHCLPNVDLQTNQYIFYNGVKYKVMYRKDYREYGYIQYIILEAWRAESL